MKVFNSQYSQAINTTNFYRAKYLFSKKRKKTNTYPRVNGFSLFYPAQTSNPAYSIDALRVFFSRLGYTRIKENNHGAGETLTNGNSFINIHFSDDPQPPSLIRGLTLVGLKESINIGGFHFEASPDTPPENREIQQSSEIRAYPDHVAGPWTLHMAKQLILNNILSFNFESKKPYYFVKEPSGNFSVVTIKDRNQAFALNAFVSVGNPKKKKHVSNFVSSKGRKISRAYEPVRYPGHLKKVEHIAFALKHNDLFKLLRDIHMSNCTNLIKVIHPTKEHYTLNRLIEQRREFHLQSNILGLQKLLEECAQLGVYIDLNSRGQTIYQGFIGIRLSKGRRLIVELKALEGKCLRAGAEFSPWIGRHANIAISEYHEEVNLTERTSQLIKLQYTNPQILVGNNLTLPHLVKTSLSSSISFQELIRQHLILS